MKKRTFFVFVAYVWTKTLLGLTFHPFTSTREMTRTPILFPVIFSPVLGLLTLFVFGRAAALLLILYGYEINKEIIAVFLSTVLISLLFWQGLLFYLLGSFLAAFRRRK